MQNKKHKINRRLSLALNHHLNALYQRYSKLLPIRIDLHYSKDSYVGVHQAQSDMDRLSKRILEHDKVVGYAWVIEYNQNDNLHFHAVFYANGQKCQRYYGIYLMIKRYWQEVTGGIGYVHDCHKDKQKYSQSVACVTSYHDEKARRRIVYSLSYLAKEEQKQSYIVNILDCLGLSAVPLPSGRGRPRHI